MKMEDFLIEASNTDLPAKVLKDNDFKDLTKLMQSKFNVDCNDIQVKAIVTLDEDELTSLMAEHTPAVDVATSCFLGIDSRGKFVYEFADKEFTTKRRIYATFKDGSLTGELS